jgi:hypothetical protein
VIVHIMTDERSTRLFAGRPQPSRVADKRSSFVYRGQQSPAQGRLSKKR